MLENRQDSSTLRQAWHLRTWISVPLALAAVSSAAAFDVSRSSGSETFCEQATPLTVGTTLRSFSNEKGASHVFRVGAPASGVLLLEVSARDPLHPEPWLELVPSRCAEDALHPGDVSYLARSASASIVRVPEPGALFFRVTSQDPRESLGEHAVTARFVETTPLAGASALGDSPESSEPSRRSRPHEPSTGREEEEETEEWEIELTRLTLPGTRNRGFVEIGGEGLCAPSEVDGDGNVFFCATEMSPGETLEKTIHNPWADDSDYFTFEISAWRSIEIETTGAVDTVGGLYDRFGQRINVDDDGGQDLNFRIVRALVPGRYFVRVAGSNGSEGPYRLRLSQAN